MLIPHEEKCTTRAASRKSYETNSWWICIVLQQFAREIRYWAVAFWLLLTSLCRKAKAYTVMSKEKAQELGSKGHAATRGAKKQILFIRHGQGDHNVSLKGWQLVDPPLTAKGQQQAHTLHDELVAAGALKEVELVVVSPLTRAIQTATGGLKGCKAPYYVHPLLRERLGAPCDEGLPKSELLATLPEMRGWGGVNELPEKWWSTENDPLFERLDEFQRWLVKRPERTIAIVGHGGFMSRILGYHLKNCGWTWRTMYAAEHATTELV